MTGVVVVEVDGAAEVLELSVPPAAGASPAAGNGARAEGEAHREHTGEQPETSTTR